MIPFYNETEARRFYLYALASFCTERAIRNWHCGSTCDNAPIVEGSQRFLGPGATFEAQGYAAQLPILGGETFSGVCIVAFRGTQPMNWANVAADYLFLTRSWRSEWCPGCRVHQGFSDAYEEVRTMMFDAIKDLSCDSVVFAGHSLGSAIATLAALDSRGGAGIHVSAVWTFGKPRVGNLAFAQEFIRAAKRQSVDPPMWRVVHYHDIIPRLAPYSLGLYYHEPLEVFYNVEDNSQYVVCGSQPTEPENLSAACMLATPFSQCGMADHNLYLGVPWGFPDSCGFGFDESGIFEAKMFGVAALAVTLLVCWICCRCCRCCGKPAIGKVMDASSSDNDALLKNDDSDRGSNAAEELHQLMPSRREGTIEGYLQLQDT